MNQVQEFPVMRYALGGAPRPELATIIPISVQRVERGDGEDGVSMPGRPPRVSPTAETVAYTAGRGPAAGKRRYLGGRETAQPALGGVDGFGVVCGEYKREQHPIRSISEAGKTKTPGR